jgi:hypothetical protein
VEKYTVYRDGHSVEEFVRDYESVYGGRLTIQQTIYYDMKVVTMRHGRWVTSIIQFNFSKYLT